MGEDLSDDDGVLDGDHDAHAAATPSTSQEVTADVCRIGSSDDHFRAGGDGGGASTLAMAPGSRLVPGGDDGGSLWCPRALRPARVANGGTVGKVYGVGVGQSPSPHG